jgi:hypothetical protein
MQKDFHPVAAEIKSVEKVNSEYNLSMNSEKTLTYTIPSDGVVELSVFTIAGQKIAVLDQGLKTAGQHTVKVKSLKVTSGLHIYRLNVDGELNNYSLMN